MALALDEILAAARVLPAQGWRNRVKDGAPNGPAETFLALVRTQVLARADASSPYSLEAETTAPVDGLIEAAATALEAALARGESPVRRLIAGFGKALEDQAGEARHATSAAASRP